MKVVIINSSVKCGGELYEEGQEYDLSVEVCKEIEGYFEPVKEKPKRNTKAKPKTKPKEEGKEGEGGDDKQNDNNGGS